MKKWLHRVQSACTTAPPLKNLNSAQIPVELSHINIHASPD
jgi:hypothetical protein